MTTQQQTPNQIAWGKIQAALRLTRAQGDFVSCLLTAVLAAAPTFLGAFMDCLGSGSAPGPDGYTPGERNRC